MNSRYNVYHQGLPMGGVEIGYQANLRLVGKISAAPAEAMEKAGIRFNLEHPVLHPLNDRGEESYYVPPVKELQ